MPHLPNLNEVVAQAANPKTPQAPVVSMAAAGIFSDVNEIGTLTPVTIKNDTAEYYFEQSVAGHLFLFPVEFVREKGVWRSLEFQV